jgi:hypothetical protein
MQLNAFANELQDFAARLTWSSFSRNLALPVIALMRAVRSDAPANYRGAQIASTKPPDASASSYALPTRWRNEVM